MSDDKLREATERAMAGPEIPHNEANVPIIEIDENGKVHLPALPTDAAQPEAPTDRVILEREGWYAHYVGPFDTATKALEVIKRSRTHPEDAPGGPWGVEQELPASNWAVWFRGVTTHTIEFRGTKVQCIAVRDRLNRLATKGEQP